jgi:uncharacterized ubiquitin-like protein YukD
MTTEEMWRNWMMGVMMDLEHYLKREYHPSMRVYLTADDMVRVVCDYADVTLTHQQAQQL